MVLAKQVWLSGEQKKKRHPREDSSGAPYPTLREHLWEMDVTIMEYLNQLAPAAVFTVPKPFEWLRAEVGKLRPGGHMWPDGLSNPACGASQAGPPLRTRFPMFTRLPFQSTDCVLAVFEKFALCAPRISASQLLDN